jgi:hypothetical protein
MSGHPAPNFAARSRAEIATPQAGRYLTQLCKHFAHRCPVMLGTASGQIAFGGGDCRLHADAGTLSLALAAADDTALLALQDVVARHLLRFAFREPMQVTWSRA